jgi:hypothetical protein
MVLYHIWIHPIAGGLSQLDMFFDPIAETGNFKDSALARALRPNKDINPLEIHHSLFDRSKILN